jgi:lipoprotein-anchoring transpeptidase ErfK/SrfK
MTRLARRLAVALGACALLAGGLVVGSLLSPVGDGAPRAAGAAPPAAVASSAAARPATARLPRGWSVVANVRGRRIAVYARPGAHRPARVLRRVVLAAAVAAPGRTPSHGHARRAARLAPLALLARSRRHGWLRVLLPVRPNGAQGWVRVRDVALRADPYALTIALRAHRLVLRRAGRVVLRAPIGVGRAATPTPRGLAYVTELLRQPDPGGLYGPWAFGLSVYSPVLTSFGGGPGQVGIHGTNDPAGIGRDVSHGCIRLRNAAIERLARLLPLGTPVRIES